MRSGCLKVQTLLNALTEAASQKDQNILPIAIEAMRARATVGEVSDALEKVFTRYHAPTMIIHGVYGSLYGEQQKEELDALVKKVDDFTKKEGRKPCLMVAKVGQDGHDRGAKIIATAFSDFGFDVDIGPLFQTPEEAALEAIEKNVHVLGLSSQAAGHRILVPQLMAALKEKGGQDIIVICGGIIPLQDHDTLYAQGVSAIFGPGTPLVKAAHKVMGLLEKRKI